MTPTITRTWSAEPARTSWSREFRHFFVRLLLCLFFVGSTLVLAFYGMEYYWLDLARRPFSVKHAALRPSGAIGLKLGMFGLFLFFLIYLYPIRKRWSWLARFGKTKYWLDYHVLFGLFAPVFISFHASFKFQGLAGIAYATMMALTISGIVGRYLYAQIPKNLGAAESTLKAMQELSDALSRELEHQQVVPAVVLRELLVFPDAEEVQKLPLGRALLAMVRLDLARWYRISRLRRSGVPWLNQWYTLGGILRSPHAKLEDVIMLASRQSLIRKQILFLAKSERVFHLWHVVHRPFSVSFAVLVILHVLVVSVLGYY